MRPQIEDFLERVRRSEEGTDGGSSDAEERVLRAVKASIALGAGPAVSVPGLSEPTSWFTQVKMWMAGASAKLGIVVAGTGALIGPGDGLIGRDITPGVPSAARAPALSSSAAPAPAPAPAPVPVDPLERQVPMNPRPAVPSSMKGAPAPRAPSVQKGGTKSLEHPPPSMSAELALLRRVQQALRRGDSAEALRELDSGLKFGTRLVVERQVARVLALCAAGRVQEARRVAAAISQAHPESIHRDTIARSCANSGRIHDE